MTKTKWIKTVAIEEKEYKYFLERMSESHNKITKYYKVL